MRSDDIVLCSFCELERNDVAIGPDLAICSSCVGRAQDQNVLGDVEACSFCRNEWDRIALQNERKGSRICTSCVQIAAGVLAERK
jgi:hypothetical protein